jgi:hypothetical protein
MWKPITVGMAVLTIASVSLVYAQQPGSRQGGQRWQPSAEDLQAFRQATDSTQNDDAQHPAKRRPRRPTASTRYHNVRHRSGTEEIG